MAEHLAYILPKATGAGHAARKRNARIAWEMAQDFLAAHCFATLRDTFELRGWAPSEWTETEPAIATIEDARARFGTEADPQSRARVWSLPSHRLSEALELFFDGERWPRQQMGPVQLSITWDLRWRALPDMERNWLTIHLDNARSVQFDPHICFPFAWDDMAHRGALDAMIEGAPFAFRDQYWKRLLVGTKKAQYSGWRKLPKGWRKSATDQP